MYLFFYEEFNDSMEIEREREREITSLNYLPGDEDGVFEKSELESQVEFACSALFFVFFGWVTIVG